MRVSHKIIMAIGCLLVVGCTTTQPNVITNYQARSISEIYGNTVVSRFNYNTQDNIAENQIPNTAIGNIYLDKPVGEFYADAMRRELRASGVSLNNSMECLISGEVNLLRVEDLGFEADIYADVSYKVTHKDEVLYELKDVRTELKVFKGGALTSVYQVVALNIKNILEDADFISSFEKACR